MLKYSALMSAALLSPAVPAQALVTCQGVVTQMNIESNGDTYVTWGSWTTRICNPGQTWTVDRGSAAGGNTTLTTATCQTLISMLMTAKAQGKQVAVHVDKTSCTFTGGFEAPYPFYFQFLP